MYSDILYCNKNIFYQNHINETLHGVFEKEDIPQMRPTEICTNNILYLITKCITLNILCFLFIYYRYL